MREALQGPWTAELTDTPYEELGESWVVDGPNGSICSVDCPRNERETVARLIAAAPELYGALLELCDSIDREEEVNGSLSGALMSDAREARATLAKIRGAQ